MNTANIPMVSAGDGNQTGPKLHVAIHRRSLKILKS
jgi:hypothetical protein